MQGRIPMTRAGVVSLKNELHRLKVVERPLVIEALAEARSHGDLSENADYDAAKDRQAFIEGRIQDIESTLARAEVIDVSQLAGSRVVFGATVTLLDTENDTRSVYRIVGDVEADVKAGRLSVSSPVAQALIGREKGDAVVVRGREFEILTVEFKEYAPGE